MVRFNINVPSIKPSAFRNVDISSSIPSYRNNYGSANTGSTTPGRSNTTVQGAGAYQRARTYMFGPKTVKPPKSADRTMLDSMVKNESIKTWGNLALKAVPVGVGAYVALSTIGWLGDLGNKFFEALGEGLGSLGDAIEEGFDKFDKDGDGVEVGEVFGGAFGGVGGALGDTFSYVTNAAESAFGGAKIAVVVVGVGATAYSGYYVYTRFVRSPNV